MDDDTTAVPAAGESPSRRPLVSTWLLAAAMALVAALVSAPRWLADPSAATPDLRWLTLLPLFALAEVVVIHLPTQRNAHGHTLREIPAVLGLTFLAPQQYVTAYVVGAVLALLVAARMRGVKLAFNAPMFALEASLGALTYGAILGGADPLSLQGWLAVLVAVLVTDLLSAAAVTAAISITEGAFDGEVLHEALRSGTVAAFINTCVALLVATLVIVQPSALPLLGVVVVLLVLGYRVYISLARGHAQTQALYRFVEQTAATRSLPETTAAVLAQAAELLHVERALLVEVVDDTHVRHHVLDGDVLRTEDVPPPPPTTWWWGALAEGVTRWERPRTGRHVEPVAVPPHALAARDGLAAPLHDAGKRRAVLVVCDRSFEKETFSKDDVQLFEALAAHAGVVLERARGVSELETLAEEIGVARDAALAASEAKSLFLANMSHEIRTPLTTVLATAEILEDTALDQTQVVLVEKMHRQGALLKSLVEQILDFSRIEAGEVVLTSAPFDLRAMVADAGDTYTPRAAAAGLLFTSRVAPDVPTVVVGDSGRVFQVLTNLLDNALKFTHEGRVELDVAVGADGALEVRVSDTGIGIAPDQVDTVFGVFNQVDGSTTRRYEGTGLGLAICRQLTELMGGTIALASEPGVGSTFTVDLPLAVPAPAPVPGPVADAPGGLVAA